MFICRFIYSSSKFPVSSQINSKISEKELIEALVSSNVKKLISLTRFNTNKQLQLTSVDSTSSPNQFANLQDENNFEEVDATRISWIIVLRMQLGMQIFLLGNNTIAKRSMKKE